MSRDYIEIYGTIAGIGPIEGGVQKLSLVNANTLGSYPVDDRFILHVQQDKYTNTVIFELNTPVTARGIYVEKVYPNSYLYGTYGSGFVRYKSKVYS